MCYHIEIITFHWLKLSRALHNRLHSKRGKLGNGDIQQQFGRDFCMFLTDLFYPQKNDLFMWASLSFYAMFPFFNQAYMPISFTQCLSIPDFYGSSFASIRHASGFLLP